MSSVKRIQTFQPFYLSSRRITLMSLEGLMFVFRCPKIGVPRIPKVQALFLTLGCGKPTGKRSDFLPVFPNYELGPSWRV
jgi:hypothetical protein